MTTPFTRTATAIAIVLVACNFHVAITAEQARQTDSRLFISEMTIVGLTEVRLGQIAAERGERANVKAFGQMMVKDHSEANAELSRIAAEMKIVPPTEIDKKHAELVERLSSSMERSSTARMPWRWSKVIRLSRPSCANGRRLAGLLALPQPGIQKQLTWRAVDRMKRS